MSGAWPPSDPARLGEAAGALVEIGDPDELRAQVAALAALLRNLGRHDESAAERDRLAVRLERAMEDGDEAAALDALRALTRLNRSVVAPVDWTAASGG